MKNKHGGANFWIEKSIEALRYFQRQFIDDIDDWNEMIDDHAKKVDFKVLKTYDQISRAYFKVIEKLSNSKKKLMEVAPSNGLCLIFSLLFDLS